MGFPSLLYYHYSTYLVVCQEVFLIFSNFFLVRSAVRISEMVKGTIPTGELTPLTDIGIIAHPVADCNRQVAQFWEKYFVQLFSQNLLTNWLGCGIMEISARTCAPGRPLYHIFEDLSIGNCTKNFTPKSGVKNFTTELRTNLRLTNRCEQF